MTYHKLNLEYFAREGIARLLGQARAFAAKDEIDATADEIASLGNYLAGAVECWKYAPLVEDDANILSDKINVTNVT